MTIPPMSSWLLAAGFSLFVVACLFDLAWRIVPNSIPLAIAVLAAGVRAINGDWLLGLASGAAVFVAAALCWRRGWLGGADVKLFSAGAMLVPPSSVIGFVLASCLAGGILAITYLGIGRLAAPPSPVRPVALLARLIRVERRRLQRRGPLPYAAAIAAGAGFVLIGA